MKLYVKAFALACALMWGIGLFPITLLLVLLEGSTGEVPFIGKVYLGYNISITGALVGLGWGFVDGLIGGAIFAWLYNLLSERFQAKK